MYNFIFVSIFLKRRNMSDTSAIEVAVKSASYNIILQILMRILSSLSNAVILRFITKEALGIINVRLLLLYSTCQFFTREAFRRSCSSKFDENNFQRKINLLWLNIPTCLACSSVMGYIWLYILQQPNSNMMTDYSLGIYVVLFSVLIESLAEPVYVFSQSYNFVKLKVVTEGLSLSVKSVLMVFFLWLRPEHSMYAFCISQVICSCVYASAFYFYFSWFFQNNINCNESNIPVNSLHDFLPKIPNFFVDWQDLSLTWSFFKQTLLKQLLTEGERYVMTFFSIMSFAEQGLYDVVSNLGSLSARFVFLPIEDSGYLLFTRLLSRNQKENSNKNLSECLQILERLMKLMLLLGLMIWIFGYSYSQLLLLLYGGSILSSSLAVTLLRWHCAYVLLLALNGITECFKFAVMNNHQIDKYNKNMVFLSSGFLFAAYFLAKNFGGVGFIIANCINMGLRIFHSVYFITCYFKLTKIHVLKRIVPHPFVVIVLLVSLLVTSISENHFCCDQGIRVWLWHLCIGISCFFIFITSVAFKETVVVKFIYEHFKKKKVDSKKVS